MSGRAKILDPLIQYGGGTVSLLVAFTGLTTKNVERVLAFLVKSGDVRAYPFLGHRKFYQPTGALARKRGLDPRRFERAPGPQAMVERLALALFCRQTGFEVIPRKEYAELFPTQAQVPSVCHSRYYLDVSHEPPRTCVVLFDFGTGLRKLLRRVRREVQERKKHAAFRDLIYPKMFQVTVVTPFESKAAKVRELLTKESLLHDVVVVPDIEDLLFPGD